MAEDTTAFACGYTNDDSGGLYRYSLDEASGELRQVNRSPLPAATFLAVHPDGTHLYATTREGGKGAVVAFRIDDETDKLVEVNRQPSGGSGPVYVSVDDTGSYVFVANYNSATIAMFPIEADGSLGEPTDTVHHEGSSVDPDRQEAAHPHSIGPGPENRFVYVPDLGMDEVRIYEIDFERGAFVPADPPSVHLHEGAGPRHFDFHPNGRFASVINELDSTITIFEYDPGTGALSHVQTAETLPAGSKGDNICAEIHVHPSGEWVYGSNRGHDSIAIYSIDPDTGRLETVGHESTRGEWPRHFALDPAGEYLFVENRNSDAIVSFAVDGSTGELTPTGGETPVPGPICLAFR